MKLSFLQFLLSLAAVGCSCSPPAGPTQPTAASTSTGSDETSTTGEPSVSERCQMVCDTYETEACTQAQEVCAPDGFNTEGECVKLLNCDQACEAQPDYYLSGDCEK